MWLLTSARAAGQFDSASMRPCSSGKDQHHLVPSDYPSDRAPRAIAPRGAAGFAIAAASAPEAEFVSPCGPSGAF